MKQVRVVAFWPPILPRPPPNASGLHPFIRMNGWNDACRSVVVVRSSARTVSSRNFGD